MRANSSERNGSSSGLADRAFDLADETTAVLVELADQEPQLAAALARRIYSKVTDRSKHFIKLRDPIVDPDNAESDLATSEAADDAETGFAHTEASAVSKPDVAFEHAKGDIQSFLKPRDIDQRSLQNRKLRGELFDDIILMLLLANSERMLVASDIKNEFIRLRIKVRDTALLSRIARLREDKALEPVSVTGTGLYRLSADGRKIAQSAKEQRVSEGS
jgi:hypothetical protein